MLAMADKNHLQMLERGVTFWNDWRAKSPDMVPDLSGADLSHQKLAAANLSTTNLEYAHLGYANLCSANFSRSNLCHANLDHAMLSQAKLLDADLSYASLKNAWLNDCNLVAANLFRAKLNHANLINTRLSGAILIGTHLQGANLTGCSVQSTFAWGVKLKGANQTNLVVNHPEQPRVLVDQLEIAQLVHLRLYKQNENRRFDAIPPRIVFVLGQYSKARSNYLLELQELIRSRGYVPLRVECNLENAPDFAMLATLIELSSLFVIDLTEPCSAITALQNCELPDNKPIHMLIQAGHGPGGAARLAQCFPQKFHAPLLYQNSMELRLQFDTEILPLPDEADDIEKEQTSEFEPALPV